MRILSTVSALVGISMIATAAVADAGVGFKDYLIGSNIAKLPEGDRAKWCHAVSEDSADVSCTFDPVLADAIAKTIADQTIKSLGLKYFSDRLESISVVLYTESYQPLKAALSEKYGAPKLKSETLQNGFGATAISETAIWPRAGAWIILQEKTDMETAGLSFTSKAYAGHVAAKSKSLSKKAAHDL